MGMRPRYTTTLTDGRVVGYNYKVRGRIFYVRFSHFELPGNYVEVATDIEVKKSWKPTLSNGEKANPPNDWHMAAVKAILKHYRPSLPEDPRKVKWEKVLDELPTAAVLRERTLETYRSTIRILRSVLPESKGPGDITPEVAKRFRHLYGSGTFKRSKKSDGAEYTRSPKTVENAVRRLNGLWGHLRRIGLVGRDNPWEDVPRPPVPKKPVDVPTEETVAEFFKYLAGRYPDWDLLTLALQVKALAGCRTMDVCGIRSANLVEEKLTFAAELDKTHKQRTIPLPPLLAERLHAIKGKTYLWESYAESAKLHRPGSRNRDDFQPKTLYWAINNLFREFNESRPGEPRLTPHSFRRRAVTLTTFVTQNIDQAAQVLGLDPSTARRYYLDAKRAYDTNELMERMAKVLLPSNSGAIMGQAESKS